MLGGVQLPPAGVGGMDGVGSGQVGTLPVEGGRGGRAQAGPEATTPPTQ